ncbi:TetR/AcrR family transcriptional regulator [Methylobacterium sp. JK268]
MAEGVGAPRAVRRGPSPDKTARTRAAIVAAALDVVLERGFSETRMIDVAERAGVAKGTLYLYFRDKEALFEGVLRETMADLVGALILHAPEPGETLRAFLRRALLPAFRALESSRRAALIRVVIAEGGRFPAVAGAYRRVVIAPVTEAIRRLAAEARARGELTSDALERFPMLLPAPGVLATLWNGLYGAEEPLDTGAVMDAYLDWVLPEAGRA